MRAEYTKPRSLSDLIQNYCSHCQEYFHTLFWYKYKANLWFAQAFAFGQGCVTWEKMEVPCIAQLTALLLKGLVLAGVSCADLQTGVLKVGDGNNRDAQGHLINESV